mgnify:CR=1 FL=1|jgi:hypothetical protein
MYDKKIKKMPLAIMLKAIKLLIVNQFLFLPSMYEKLKLAINFIKI